MIVIDPQMIDIKDVHHLLIIVGGRMFFILLLNSTYFFSPSPPSYRSGRDRNEPYGRRNDYARKDYGGSSDDRRK